MTQTPKESSADALVAHRREAGLLPSDSFEDGPWERLGWGLLLCLLVQLPLSFLPWTVEVYILPKAALLWVLAGGASACVVIGGLRRGVLVVPSGPGVRALLLFCLAAAAATAGSAAPLVGLLGAFMRREGLLSLVAYALIYVLMVRLATTRHRAELGVWALVVPALPTGIYAISQAFGFELVRELNPTGRAVRAYGMLGNADFLGIYCALVIPILFAAFLKSRGWRQAYVGASLFVIVPASLLAYSRGGWIGAAIGMTLLVVLMGRDGMHRRRRSALAATLVIACALGISFGLRAIQKSPPESGFVQHAATTVQLASGTAATRLEIWPRVLPLLADSPLLGFGPESFRGRFMPVRGERLVALEGTSRWDRPHNSLLYLAYAVGLVGLIAYLAFLGASVAVVLRARQSGPGRGSLALGLVAGAAGASVAEFFVLWSPATTPLIFAALGLAVATVNAAGCDCVHLRGLTVPSWGRIGGIGLAVLAFAAVTWAAVQSVRADYYADMGRLAMARGSRAESINYYDRAVDAAPWVNDYRWRAARGWAQSGFLARNMRDLTVAEVILLEGLRYDPFDEQGYAQLGQTYRYMATVGGARTMPRSIEAYRRALRLDPFSPAAGGGLAHVFFLRKEYARARSQALRVLKHDPSNVDMLLLVGYASEQTNERAAARAYFGRAAKADPSSAAARAGLRRQEP